MILIDTSVWIEFFKTKDQFTHVIMQAMRQQRVVAAECVFGELLQGVKNPRERDVIFSYWQNLPKCDESGLWIEAGRLSMEKKLFSKGVGLIDAFLITFARRYRTKIWSLDKKLLSVLDSSEIFDSTQR